MLLIFWITYPLLSLFFKGWSCECKWILQVSASSFQIVVSTRKCSKRLLFVLSQNLSCCCIRDISKNKTSLSELRELNVKLIGYSRLRNKSVHTNSRYIRTTDMGYSSNFFFALRMKFQLSTIWSTKIEAWKAAIAAVKLNRITQNKLMYCPYVAHRYQLPNETQIRKAARAYNPKIAICTFTI